jgi:environmental stress-induced protein Ves
MAPMTTLVRIDEVMRQPWRNSGGRTRELLAWPESSNWAFRISVADIEADGAFSIFPGVQRWFAVLEGAGVELTIDGFPKRLTRNAAPLRFSGASVTTCRLLDGPTLDLNLMLRDAPGRIQAVADGAEWRPALAQCGLFTAVAGHCRADGATTTVPSCALLWFERAPASLSFAAVQGSPSAPGWWLEAGAEETPR